MITCCILGGDSDSEDEEGETPRHMLCEKEEAQREELTRVGAGVD
jgi:hypothetical protein